VSDIDDELEQLGIVLPSTRSPIANYVPGVRVGNLLYLSGVGPALGADGETYFGKLGSDLCVDDGYRAARLVGVNLISRIKGELGDLGRVKCIVKPLSMVNATAEFTEHPAVANGCSDLLVEVFADKGRHARSAVGMGSLPGGIPVEIEMIVEVDEDV
jgi:enamine deaminase RidA (YjgF/YER057c/UK114 family)